MNIIKTLQRIKHSGFVLKKTTAQNIENYHDKFLIKIDKYIKYKYKKDNYTKVISGKLIPESYTFSVNHLLFNQQISNNVNEESPLRLFCIWAGNNPVTPNRLASLEKIRKANKDIEVILIDNSNLNKWIIPEHPLPKAYKDLSYVHRSDYLRAYLMHHHGGAYSDIKDIDEPWLPLINRLNLNKDAWVIGPQEISSFNCSPVKGKLGKDQEKFFMKLICPAAMACKPRTPFTHEWLNEAQRRLRYYEDILEKNPAEQPWGDNLDYPVAWNALMGQIFSPLCLKYGMNIIVDTKTNFTSVLRASVQKGNHR